MRNHLGNALQKSLLVLILVRARIEWRNFLFKHFDLVFGDMKLSNTLFEGSKRCLFLVYLFIKLQRARMGCALGVQRPRQRCCYKQASE